MEYIIDAEGFHKYVMMQNDHDLAMVIGIMAEAMIDGDTPKVKWLKKVEKKQRKKKVMNSYSEPFEEFWKLYPKQRRSGKGAAYKSWQKYDDPLYLLEECKKALEWQKRSDQWKADNGKYIPLPTTYLNQYRFNDEEPEYTNPKKIQKAY